MTLQELREKVNPALMLAAMAASFTKTKKDDEAVALLQRIVNNDEIAGGILELLAKEGN